MEFIFFKIKELLYELSILTNDNDMVSAVIVASILGSMVWVIKESSSFLYKNAMRQITTTITISSDHTVFYRITRYLSGLDGAKKARTISLTSFNSWGETISSLGLGTHYLYIEGEFMKVHLDEDKSGTAVIQNLTITKLGRGHSSIKSMIEKSNEETHTGKTSTTIYQATSDRCELIKEQDKVPMNAIIMPKAEHDNLFSTIDKFLTHEDWYKEKHIPYQLGICLYGPPGTGKTMLMKVIAGYLNKNIIQVNTISGLTTANKEMTDNDLIVIEEIDTLGVAKRKLDGDDDDDSNELSKYLDDQGKWSLGKMLSDLDGIISTHGRILIISTNDYDSLDPALVRPGRIDISVNMTHLIEETYIEFLKKFDYDTTALECTDFKMKEGISPTMLQKQLRNDKTLEELNEKFLIH